MMLPVPVWQCIALLLLRWFVPAVPQGSLSMVLSDQALQAEQELRMTLRSSQFRNAPSCQKTSAQLEIHNLHPSETTIIHSVAVVAEETSWQDPRTGERQYWGSPLSSLNNDKTTSGETESPNVVEEAKRRQMHVSPLPGDTDLVLAPNQVAILPITFLPRFPPDHQPYIRPTSSISPPHRISLGSKVNPSVLPFPGDPLAINISTYSVKALLEIETSRGTMRIPVAATSASINDYGLPSVITFNLSNHSVLDFGKWHRRFKRRKHCSHLYIKNPENHQNAPNLHVEEVSLSNPSHLHLEFIDFRHPTQPSQVRLQQIRRWPDGGGPLRIQPDGKLHYVVSVCAGSVPKHNSDALNIEQLDNLESDHPLSLGFVWIRTDADSLVVALERSNSTYSTISQDKTRLAYVSSMVSSQLIGEKLAREPMISHPESLELTLLAGVDLISRSNKTISLQSIGQESLRITRASIVIKDDTTGSNRQDGVKLRIVARNTLFSRPLAPNIVIDNAFTFEITVDWSKCLEPHMVVRGFVIISSIADVREGDRAKPSENCHSDEHHMFGLEVPFEIHLAKATLGLLIPNDTNDSEIIWQEKRWSGSFKIVEAAYFPEWQVVRYSRNNHALGDKVEYFQDVQVVVDVNVNVTLSDVSILDPDLAHNPMNSGSKCSRFRVVRDDSASSAISYFDNSGSFDFRRSFRILYDLPVVNPVRNSESDKTYGSSSSAPTVCFLRFSHLPGTGQHSFPLIIYDGNLEIATSSFQSTSVEHSHLSHVAWSGGIVGFESLVDWLRSTKQGNSLRSLLVSSKHGNSVETERDLDRSLLKNYLMKLTGPSFGRSRLTPALFDVGAVAPGQVETMPVYLTNHNPVPIEIRLDVSAVEGMSINIGREHQASGEMDSMLNNIQRVNLDMHIKAGHFKGHPRNGLRNFLLNGRATKEFLSQFSYTTAIKSSSYALSINPMIGKLYLRYSRGSFHRFPREPHTTKIRFAEFNKSVLGKGDVVGPVLLSTEVGELSRLKVSCHAGNLNCEMVGVTLPPGGIVRVDINVTVPTHNFLDKEITELVSTGLVISTDSIAIPIFLVYKRLKTKLSLTYMDLPPARTRDSVELPVVLFSYEDASASRKSSLIDARLSLYHDRLRNEYINGSVPLFVNSSFPERLQLMGVVSCNPWLRNISPKAEHQSQIIGSLSTFVSCDPESSISTSENFFPSFFRCLVNWFLERSDRNPRQCSQGYSHRYLPKTYLGPHYNPQGIGNIVHSFRNALIVVEHSFVVDNIEGEHLKWESSFSQSFKSGYRHFGTTDLILLNSVARAQEGWQTTAALGYLTIETCLRAILEYNGGAKKNAVPFPSKDETENDTFHVPIKGTSFKSVLKMPMLIRQHAAVETLTTEIGDSDGLSFVDFPTVLVGDLSVAKIPIVNPTIFPLRVRLGKHFSASHISVLNGTSLIVDPAVSGYLKDIPPPFSSGLGLISNREISKQWWGPLGAYYQPDIYGNVLHSHHNTTIKGGSGVQFSLLNPSVSFNTAFLTGCATRSDTADDATMFKSQLAYPLTSIGASSSSNPSVINRRRLCSSTAPVIEKLSTGASLIDACQEPLAFAIPPSAVDEIIVPPFGEGELGPVFFRPPGRKSNTRCPLLREKSTHNENKSDVFESLIIVENSLTGIERVVVRGRSGWERVFLVEPTRADSFWFGDMALKNGKATLMFPGTADISMGFPRYIRKEIILVNAGDTTINVSTTMIASKPDSDAYLGSSKCKAGDFTLLSCGMQAALDPGQNLSLSIIYEPKCTKQMEFHNLYIQLGTGGNVIIDRSRRNVRNASRHKHLTLAFGYEMTFVEFLLCTPVPRRQPYNIANGSNSEFTPRIPVSRKWNVIFRLQPILSFLIRFGMVTISFLYVLGILTYRVKGYFGLEFPGRSKKERRLSEETYCNWLSAFRCLSGIDPSAFEIQAIGREQTRQISLLHYRKVGVLPPHYFNHSGLVNRERAATIVLGDGRISNASERTRTMSDALFGDFIQGDSVKLAPFPSNLCWQVAVARGIVNSLSLDSFGLLLETHEYLASRSTQSISVDDTGDFSDRTSEEEKTNSEGSSNQFEKDRSEGTNHARFHDGEASRMKIATSTSADSLDSPLAEKAMKKSDPFRLMLPKEADKSRDGHHESDEETNKESELRTNYTALLSHKINEPSSLAENDGQCSTMAKPAEKPKSPPFYPKPNKASRNGKKERKKAVIDTTRQSLNESRPSTIRPPPGLRPPPGFHASSAFINNSSSDRPETQVQVDIVTTLESIVATPDISTGSNVRQAAQSEALTDLCGSLDRVGSPALFSRLRSSTVTSVNDGFDVIAFLDDILNEGSTSIDDGISVKPTAKGEHISMPHPSSQNPWATSAEYLTSRAAEYGISIEDETRDSQNTDVLPLLTPDAIFSAIAIDDEQKDRAEISFFSDLLDETGKTNMADHFS